MEEVILYLESTIYIIPLIIVGISLILGYIFQTFIIGRLSKLSAKTKWEGDDIFVKGIDSAPVLWFLIIGLYFAIQKLPIELQYKVLSWQILVIVLIISASIIAARISVGFVKYYATKSSGGVQSTSILTILTKVTIYLIAGLIVLQTFGISITPILTALGVGGLAVALALQETLSNLFAGIHLIASKKTRPGDYIELDDTKSGFIEDISWRNTTIRTLGNNLIIIPNSKIASATITNYTKPQMELSVLIDVGVSYDSDLEKVEKTAIEVGKQIQKDIEGGIEDFEPLVRFHTFGESSIDLKVILRVKEFVNQYLIKHEFIKAIHKRFNQEGIEIPFPQRVIHTEEK